MNRALVAHTPLGRAIWAISLAGEEAMSALYEFRVGLRSDNPGVDCQALIGELCAVALEAHKGITRYFSGQIVRFEALGKHGEHWHYEAVVAPKLWHASRRSDFRIWQNLTVQQIVDEVLGLNGIRYEWRLKQSYKTWEYSVQYNETDLAFISRLLEHEGIFYFFEHSATGETLVLADHFSIHEPVPGYERTPFYPPDAAPAGEDHFSAWRLAREVEPGRFVHRDYDFKRPWRDLTTEHIDPRGHLFDHYERYAYPGNYVEPADGQAYASARLEAMQTGQDLIALTGRVRGACPGTRFTLFNHPRPDQNRELVVVRAVYQASNNAYEGAGGSEASSYQVQVQAIPSERAWRPLLNTPKPRTRGPETAVVVGPAGSEIHTDEYGRVKVHFHWDRYGKMDGSDSCWIRVAHSWAGANYGAIHIPRVGQEVIVDFEHGDPDRPIITGRVYNAAQMPPWDLPANATQSGILTRSATGNASNANAIRFEDKKDKEELWIHAEKDLNTEVEHCESRWVGVDRQTNIDRDDSFVIGRDRTTSVGNNEDVTVHNDRRKQVVHSETLSIGDNRVADVGIDDTTTIGQHQTLRVGRNQKRTVGHNVQDKIGKSWSMKVGKNKTETISMAYMQNVGMGRLDNVGMGFSLNVGLGMNTIVGMSQSSQIGKNMSTTVGTQYTLNVGAGGGGGVGIDGACYLVAPTGGGAAAGGEGSSITMDGEHITLKVGDSTLVLRADGTILANGKTIAISGPEHILLSSERIDLN